MITISDNDLEDLIHYGATWREDHQNQCVNCRVRGALPDKVVDVSIRMPAIYESTRGRAWDGFKMRDELKRLLRLRLEGSTDPELYEWI